MKKRKKLVTSALVTLSILLILAIVLLIVGGKFLNERRNKIDQMQAEMNANKQILYVASSFIAQGDTIEEDKNVMLQEVYTGLEPYCYITKDDLGSIACVDIEENMPIMKNMTQPFVIDHDTREYELNVVNLMADQTENDYVDVRIMFPTGEDFIVLAKKQITNLDLKGCRFDSYLTEEEILRIASATIDAYTITGTRIYTTRYVEQNLQHPATPNYLVKQETIDLINSDPNVLDKAQETLNKFARLELEERISMLSSDQLTAVAKGHGLEDTAQGQALSTGTNTEKGNEDSENENLNDETLMNEEETNSDAPKKDINQNEETGTTKVVLSSQGNVRKNTPATEETAQEDE